MSDMAAERAYEEMSRVACHEDCGRLAKRQRNRCIEKDVAAFVRRILDAQGDRRLTGKLVFEMHFSESGLGRLDARFTERLK